MGNSITCFQVFKTHCSWCMMQKYLQIMSLSLRWSCSVHAPNTSSLFSFGPLVQLLIPYIVFWNFIVLDYSCIRITLIQLEPCKKCGILWMQNSLSQIILMKDHNLWIFFMYSKLLNTWFSAMYIKFPKVTQKN